MKRLLITIDGSPNDQASLKSAMLLARRLEAEISVVHTALPPAAYYGFAEATAPLMFDSGEESEAMAGRARAAFDAVCADWPGAEWSMTEESSAEAIARLGPFADLVVVERLSREEGPSAAGFNTALFDGAGPVFVTPPEPKSTFAANPVIAWNGSREAARSVKSAMALLQPAGRVTVLCGDDQSSDSIGSLKKYLGAYGVTAAVEGFSSDQLTARGRARALLEAADALSADFLVMGAYGENAVSAIFGLGRATRKIVTAARIPVLLHH